MGRWGNEGRREEGKGEMEGEGMRGEREDEGRGKGRRQGVADEGKERALGEREEGVRAQGSKPRRYTQHCGHLLRTDLSDNMRDVVFDQEAHSHHWVANTV